MPDFLTPKELATRWRLNQQTPANWRSERRGPRWTKIGSKVLYPFEGIQSYEQSNQSWLAQQQSPDISEGTLS